MSEQTTGRVSFGLDLEGMVSESWRIFVGRPLTFLGIALLLTLAGGIARILLFGTFFCLPFSLCIPFAAVQILRGEKSDRSFLGWVDRYPTLLALFVPAALGYLLLVGLVPSSHPWNWGSPEHWLRHVDRPHLEYLLPALVGKTLAFTIGLAGLLVIRKNLSATEAMLRLFSSPRHALEAFLLGGTLALFSLSGILICCVGVVATNAFAWICLGVAYCQMFEE